MQNQTARLIALTGALLGWFAIITQFYLIIANRVVTVPETIFRFFGYFTIDTNILVALCFTFIFLEKKSRARIFFCKASTITALTVYITIVGLVYNTLLRSRWQPEGMQKVVDEILHSVIPAIFILFWIFFTRTRNLKWKDALTSLLYPAGFITYSLLLGAITNFYPYYFVDVNRIGYAKVLVNTANFLIAIVMLSLILIATGKSIKKIDPNKNSP